MRKTNITESHSTGHGSLLLAALAKFNGHTINKTSTVTFTKARTIATTTAPTTATTTPRMGLFEPMFVQTKAINLAKAAAPLPTPHGPREDIKAPQPPSASTSVTATSIYTMRPDPVFNADDLTHVHAAQLRITAQQRAAVLAQIKNIHAGGNGAAQ